MLSGKLKYPDTTPPTVPVIEPSFLPTRHASDMLRATWLGHACYYIEYPSGLRVLFDPVFEDRCSPFTFMGPKRYTPPPCAIGDLPFVDAVVISHSHYDHLSHPSVREVQKHFPRAHFFVGMGLARWFQREGLTNVTELDWWEDAEITLTADAPEAEPAPAEMAEADSKAKQPAAAAPANGTPSGQAAAPITARISCLPCQHTSARTAFDKDTTLWCSWAVSSGTPAKSVWFGGDTGYRAVPYEAEADPDGGYGEKWASLPHNPQFTDIGRLRGPFDLGLIPIGAYSPRYIFSPMHGNPHDAVEMFRDTGCRRAMGIHWGTWALTLEEVLEPPRVLKAAMKRRGLPETGVFDVCDIGESREF